MARAGSYDDWTFMGDMRNEDLRGRSTRAEKSHQVNEQRNSFIFLCVVILLTLMGLVCVYSASFGLAVGVGLPHYYFLLRQLMYVGIGTALAVLVNLIPEKGIRFLSPLMFFVCIAALAVDTFSSNIVLVSPDTVNFLFLSGVMYLSLYFSGRNNSLERARQIIPPVVGCLIVLALLLLQRNFSYALMFSALAVTMFAAGGVGLVGIILLILYPAVPLVCRILSKSDRILAVADFLIPGFGSGGRTDSVLTVKSAIASGSWFGKGLGAGSYKAGIISDIAGKNILACVCEEMGFWGFVMVIMFFGFLAVIGYITAISVRRQSGYFSDMATGITTMIVWQFILNVTWVLGYLPGAGMPLPFFSYGSGVICILLESGLLYRITRARFCEAENGRLMETIQDELMFPERYDLENP